MNLKPMYKYILLVVLLCIVSCSLWDYKDNSDPLGNQYPETFLTLVAADTIYVVIEDILEVIDTLNGTTTYDTIWNFSIGSEPADTMIVVDTLGNAFTTITTSQQPLSWWGEDPDGNVTGYYYKWNTDNEWSWTTSESQLFYVPIRKALDVFSFSVRAVDDAAKWEYDEPVSSEIDNEYFSDVGDSLYVYDSHDVVLSEGDHPGIQTSWGAVLKKVKGTEIYKLVPTDTSDAIDPTPATLTFPIRNSHPEVEFRYGSNPTRADHGSISYTFPTRTFIWDAFDLDGRETITYFYYALDDTCDTCWITLDAQVQSSVTFPNSFSVLTPGEHTFYLKAKDIAGAESPMIQFPDSTKIDECQTWIVKSITGNTLLVDDFPLDVGNDAQHWYSNALESILGTDQFSIWEIGDALPYSSVDVLATLSYFDNIIWYTAYTQNETYNDASASILSFVQNGGNFFINATELKDTSFVWFPIQSRSVINPNGRFFPNRIIASQVPGLDSLVTSFTIGVRVKSFIPDSSQFATIKDLYHLSEPISGDGWTGTPNVCSLGQLPVPPNGISGKIVLFSIPMHTGANPTMEGGEGSGAHLLEYLLTQEFIE